MKCCKRMQKETSTIQNSPFFGKNSEVRSVCSTVRKTTPPGRVPPLPGLYVEGKVAVQRIERKFSRRKKCIISAIMDLLGDPSIVTFKP